MSRTCLRALEERRNRVQGSVLALLHCGDGREGVAVVVRVHRGRVDERIEVADLVTVVGGLNLGAHVLPGATLRVEGELHGLLVIEPEGTVVVDGAVTGEVINRGYLMVAGHLACRIRQDRGMIAVAAGSFVTATDGRLVRVDADGHLHSGADRSGRPPDGRSYLRRMGADRYLALAGRR